MDKVKLYVIVIADEDDNKYFKTSSSERTILELINDIEHYETIHKLFVVDEDGNSLTSTVQFVDGRLRVVAKPFEEEN